MGLRVCLVTPFAWSRPHDVNEHVAGIAAELRALGHSVTVLAPSTRAADLIAGRRALLDGAADRVLSPGVDTELFKPGRKRKLVVYEWRPAERALARSVTRALRELPGWELVLLRTKALSGRPTIPRSLRGRARIRTLRSGAARAPLLNETAIFVPAFDGVLRVSLQ